MDGSQPYTVLLVDDHTLFRGGLKLLLDGHPDYRVAGEASTGIEMLDWLAAHPRPDAVLLDIAMPGMSGIEAAAEALRRDPELRIITLSMFGEQDYYFQMVSLGVKGFLLKNSHIEEVYAALRQVLEGGSYFSQELLFNLVSNLRTSSSEPEPEAASDPLSEREREILLLICKGMTNAEIGERLFISKRTVDKHRANILEKTACKNTANLVVYAIKHRMVEI